MKTRLGQWTALFGARKTFQEEMAQAVEVDAHWSSQPGQRDVVVDDIPGWLPPMWGSDREWLYLRRPEGVWKARLPPNLSGGTLISLYQRRGAGTDASSLFGGMVLGAGISNVAGWVRGRDTANPMSAADRDERASPSARGYDVDADAVASSWGKEVSSEEGKLVLEAGDHFDKPPTFELRDKWIVAEDRQTGLRVAYPFTSSAMRERIESGQLWLRYSSRWFDGFSVQVVPT